MGAAKKVDVVKRAKAVRKAFADHIGVQHPGYVPKMKKAGGAYLRGLNDTEIEALYTDWSLRVANAFYLPLTDETLADFTRDLARKFTAKD